MNIDFKLTISKLIRYLNPIPMDLRKSFVTTIDRENIIRMIPFSIVYILLNSEMFIFGRREAVRGTSIREYTLIFLVLTCIYSIYLVIKQPKHTRWYDHIIISVFCLVLVFSTLLASQMALVRIGSMSLFTVTILTTSTFFIRRPIVAILTNFSAFIYFIASLDRIVDHSEQMGSNLPMRAMGAEVFRFEIYITEILLISIVSRIIAVVMFRFRAKSFMDHKIIEDKNHRLMEINMQDSMTKLLNHKTIIDMLVQEVSRTVRYDLELSVLLLDIDHFKAVNDTYGHPIGDEVIVQVSETLRHICRETDYIGRYGGEEFLIILTNTDKEQSMILSERIRQHIEKADFGDPSPVTISGGITTHANETAKELIHDADEALYEAKNRGRNRLVHSKD